MSRSSGRFWDGDPCSMQLIPSCRCPNPAAACPVTQVVAVTPPADEWAQAVMGFGVPEGVARDLANM